MKKKLKQILKSSKWLFWLNSQYKSFQLQQTLNKLQKFYTSEARRIGYTYKLNDAVDTFKNRVKTIRPDFVPKPAGTLRVFWVGANKDQDETGFLQALHRVADVVTYYNFSGKYGLWDKSEDFLEGRRINDDAIYDQLYRAHQEKPIDILMGQLWATLVSEEGLSKVRALGIPTINIAMDDRLPLHWGWKQGVRLGSVGLGSGVDMVLTTCAETCLWYGVEGIPAMFWPLASDSGVFTPQPGAQRDIDVLFIGNRYGIREKIVTDIEKHGISVSCYGNGWKNGFIGAEKNGELSKRAKIILGVGTVGHCSGVYTLKLRDFDAMMTGALYITHRNPDLCQIFTEGEEIEYYKDSAEVSRKIQFYLAHPQQREAIGLAGQRKAMLDHNWDKRISQTFLELGLVSS